MTDQDILRAGQARLDARQAEERKAARQSPPLDRLNIVEDRTYAQLVADGDAPLPLTEDQQRTYQLAVAQHRLTRELDAQVAERIMGWRNVQNRNPAGNSWWGEPPEANPHGTALPYYSTLEMDALDVLDQMIRRGWLYTSLPAAGDQPAQAAFKRDGRQGHATAPTLEEAICRAALAAVQPA